MGSPFLPAPGVCDASLAHQPDAGTVATPPLVSVIVPAYRAQDTLGGTITSILTQTYPSIEMIVVDDGSDDDTLVIARSYGDRVRVIEKRNGGASSARNAGAAVARGKFLAFCDADDILLPPYLQSMVAEYDRAGGGRRVVTSNAYPLTSEGINPRRSTVLPEAVPLTRQRLAVLQRNIATMFCLFPRSVYEEIGGLDEGVKYIEDWDLWRRVAYADIEIVYQQRPLALYRWTPGSLSSNSEQMLRAEDEMLAELMHDPDVHLHQSERAYLAERIPQGSPYRLRTRADDLLRDRDYAKAGALYRQASRLAPLDRKLRLRARTVGVLPGAGQLWRTRIQRIESEMGRKGQ